MKTFSIIFYFVIAGVTLYTVWPKDTKLSAADKIILPILSLIWPLPWAVILINEFIGYMKRRSRERHLKKIQPEKDAFTDFEEKLSPQIDSNEVIFKENPNI